MGEPTTEQPRGSGTAVGYHVEVRSTLMGMMGPPNIGGFIVTRDWRQLSIRDDLRGIPNNQFSTLAREQHLLTYEAALGIAAHFQASANFCPCLEFRLVKVKFEYSWSVREEGVGEPFDFFGAERKATFAAREP